MEIPRPQVFQHSMIKNELGIGDNFRTIYSDELIKINFQRFRDYACPIFDMRVNL